MGEPVVDLASFAEVSEYVRAALCEQDALDPSQTPFFRTLVRRGGRPWGVVYHAEGPRQLRTSAVWAAGEDRIVFYDSTGQRVREVRTETIDEFELIIANLQPAPPYRP
jgi:hypothetical protein